MIITSHNDSGNINSEQSTTVVTNTHQSVGVLEEVVWAVGLPELEQVLGCSLGHLGVQEALEEEGNPAH